MKKIAALMLILCATALAASCDGGAASSLQASVEVSSASEISSVSSAGSTSSASSLNSVSSEKTEWEIFLEEMEGQGLLYEDIHSLENHGLIKQEIMAMSAEDIKIFLQNVRDNFKERKAYYAAGLLADLEAAKSEPYLVLTGDGKTTNLNVIEECIDWIKANDWGSFTGLMLDGIIPQVYEISYKPDENVILTVYTASEVTNVSEYVVTDIYETEMFYQFSDNKGLYFSVPKQPNYFPEALDSDRKNTNFPGSKVSAAQACEAAADISVLLNSYITYTRNNNLGNPFDAYGVIIPEYFTTDKLIDPANTVISEGAARILGGLYYQISFYKGDKFTGDTYYIGAENIENIFVVDMAHGGLIPVSHKGAEHFTIK